ncbi:morphogenic membrane protein MmpB [Streptomyces sp. PU-14G]
MLWSDPRDEPPPELRRTQEKVHRLGWVLLLVVAVVMLLLLSVAYS